MNAQERVQELCRIFAAPGADTVQLLCETHPQGDVAFTVVDANLGFDDVTYGELRVKSQQFAAALASLGIQRGDRVATLMGTSVELVIALLGIWRLGAIDVPLLTALAPDAISLRLRASAAKLVICDADQRTKLVLSGHVPNDASTPVVVAHGEAFGYDSSFAEMVQGRGAFSFLNADAGSLVTGGSVAVGGDGVLVELFSSERTGTPTAVPVPLRSVASFVSYLEFALDVRGEDVFFNAAAPGCVYGLYFALMGPMACGTRSIIVAAELSPAIIWSVLQKFKVTNFAAESNVYRALWAGSAPDSSAGLRRASSAGVPLTPDVIEWGQESFGVEIRDQYGRTELGMVAANPWAEGCKAPLRPESMGVSLPGWSVDILREGEDTLAPIGESGRVAVNIAKSPFFWFTGYVDAPGKPAQRLTADEDWYVTGDAGYRDADGYLYLSPREDDARTLPGCRFGPVDEESVLVTHPKAYGNVLT